MPNYMEIMGVKTLAHVNEKKYDKSMVYTLHVVSHRYQKWWTFKNLSPAGKIWRHFGNEFAKYLLNSKFRGCILSSQDIFEHDFPFPKVGYVSSWRVASEQAPPVQTANGSFRFFCDKGKVECPNNGHCCQQLRTWTGINLLSLLPGMNIMWFQYTLWVYIGLLHHASETWRSLLNM